MILFDNSNDDEFGVSGVGKLAVVLMMVVLLEMAVV